MDSSDSSSLCFDSSMDDNTSGSLCFDSSLSTDDPSPVKSGTHTDFSGNRSSSSTSPLMDDDNFDQPLYPGATLTYFESHLQVFQYALRHRLTKLAFGDLLNLIDNHLPPTNSMVSLYKLKKHFLHLYRDITYTTHFCCSSCHACLPTLETPCPNDCEDEAMEFLSISVIPQLKRRLEGMSLPKYICYVVWGKVDICVHMHS